MLTSDQNLESNLISSIEAFIFTNVVTPYNAAVAGSTFNEPLTILMDSPDDPATVAQTPAITIELPTDYKLFESTGMGDREGYLFKQFKFKCYPALSGENNVIKPSITATGYLRSLMGQINTALTIPLSDYTTTPPTLMDFAYIDGGQIVKLAGAISMLAIDKHRFDYQLRIRFPVLTLNG